MGSTHNGSPSQTGSSPQRSLFDEAKPRIPERSDEERGLSADPNVPLQTEAGLGVVTPLGPQPVATEPSEPLWAQRLKLVIFVLFSVELGMFLVVLPWLPVWQHNSLIANHPALRQIFQHSFTRGAVTGLGLIDIWVGIWSAVQYREKE